MQALLRRRSAEGPSVAVYDDLHWGDPASVDLIGELFAVAEDTPILFLWTMRPERESAAWRLKERAARDYPHLFHELDVAPLDTSACRMLLESLLPGARLPEPLVARVLDRAEGNPLFVEELARAMEDQGVVRREGDTVVSGAIDDLRLPETVQGIVAARIDRLDPDTKRTLQLASVIGRTFDYDVLREIDELDGLDRRLLALQRGELIRELQREPDRKFAFRHALTQEAAYESLLQRRRRDIHRLVAETLEVRHQARQEEFAGIIGRHFADAADPRGVGYLRIAGDRALRVHAVDDAIENYRAAMALITPATESEVVTAVAIGLGRAYEFHGRYDEALATYEALEQQARLRESASMEAVGLTQRIIITATPTSRRDLPQARSLLERAMPLAQRGGDPRVQARLGWAHMQVETWSRNAAQGVIAGKEAARLAREHDLPDVLALTLNDLARTIMSVGRVEEATPYQDEDHHLAAPARRQADARRRPRIPGARGHRRRRSGDRGHCRRGGALDRGRDPQRLVAFIRRHERGAGTCRAGRSRYGDRALAVRRGTRRPRRLHDRAGRRAGRARAAPLGGRRPGRGRGGDRYGAPDRH